MKKLPHLALLGTLVLFTRTLVCAVETKPPHFFSDPVSYSAWDTGASPMNAVWRCTSGASPGIEKTAGGIVLFSLENGVVTTALTRPVNSGFELKFEALHTDYSRILWIALLNKAGTQGYGLAWDSSSAGNFDGEGFVSIRKFDTPSSPSTLLTFNTSGTAINSIQNSGHIATTAPLAKFKLTWQKSTRTLRLYVDDVLKQTVKDDSFETFASLYIGGSTGSRFDNITVAAPK